MAKTDIVKEGLANLKTHGGQVRKHAATWSIYVISLNQRPAKQEPILQTRAWIMYIRCLMLVVLLSSPCGVVAQSTVLVHVVLCSSYNLL
jgi:hypothetical protein